MLRFGWVRVREFGLVRVRFGWVRFGCVEVRVGSVRVGSSSDLVELGGVSSVRVGSGSVRVGSDSGSG